MASLSYYLKRSSKNTRSSSTRKRSISIKDCEPSFPAIISDLSTASKYVKSEKFYSHTPHEQLKTVFIQDRSVSYRPISSSTYSSNASRYIKTMQTYQISSEGTLNNPQGEHPSQGYLESEMIPKGIIMLDRPASSKTPRFPSRSRRILTNENSDPFEKYVELYTSGFRSSSRPRSSSSSAPRKASHSFIRPREVLDSQQVQELIRHEEIKVKKEEPVKFDPVLRCYE
jgi:hypothetical protein